MASSDTRAAATSSLSAMGSRGVPRVVTWFASPGQHPVRPVGDGGEDEIAAAITAWTRDDEIRTHEQRHRDEE